MGSASKILHWLIFFIFLGLVTTAIAANVLFSKEAIMESFAFSLPAIDIEIAPSDQLFMARVARRFTWALHFWMGILFMSAALLRFILFIQGRTIYRLLHLFTFLLIVIIFFSGLPLYLRIYFDISAEVQQIARTIHYMAIWIISLFVIWHIAWVVYLENSKKPGALSQMFRFKGKFFLFIGFLLLYTPHHIYAANWNKDPDYQRAVAYMKGEIGISTSSKTIKNCPYAKCDEVADSINGNVKTITLKTKNYPRMVAHFEKSITRGNPLAAKKLAKFLLGRIDYRSKIPDPTLIKIGERDTGQKYAVYLKLAQKSLQMAADAGDCYSMYKLAEFKRQGWMGFAKDTEAAQNYYKKIIKNCDTKSFFYMMSQAKVN